jgi:hypothetical protein
MIVLGTKPLLTNKISPSTTDLAASPERSAASVLNSHKQ